MNTHKIKISLHGLNDGNFKIPFKRDENNYFVDLITDGKDYFCRKEKITLEITKNEYENILINPYLYYFSSALRLHCRFKKAKELDLGFGWPDRPAALIEEIFK